MKVKPLSIPRVTVSNHIQVLMMALSDTVHPNTNKNDGRWQDVLTSILIVQATWWMLTCLGRRPVFLVSKNRADTACLCSCDDYDMNILMNDRRWMILQWKVCLLKRPTYFLSVLLVSNHWAETVQLSSCYGL
jgi:hypothetical protein